VKLTIDGKEIETKAGTTILEAAKSAGIYIPTLCYHPDLPPARGAASVASVFQGAHQIDNAAPEEPGKSCGLCVVEVQGSNDLLGSCATELLENMVVITNSERVREKRRENLIPILARHRHACLTCAQREGCGRSQCSGNVAENERCCSQFGYCELQRIADYIGISPATPKWHPPHDAPIKEEPLFERDYSLCIGCTRCVRACRDLRGIEAIGFVYDRKKLVQIGSIGPTLADSGCKFCTACVEVCPTGALMDKVRRPAKTEEDRVPCRAACPVGIDIPGYLRLIAAGNPDAANAVIREKVPLPGVLGRICIHPCENACRRGEINEPISICALKRFAATGDEGLWRKNANSLPPTGKKVAIIGAGPAGLTAAFYLRKRGHSVTLFDAADKAGGMLRYGIPDFRLPAHILDKEIDDILGRGIAFKPNQTLGKDISLAQLKAAGFDAVFLAVGAQLSRKIPLEGCELPDVLWGIDFLRKVSRGEKIRLKENVVVIGGGNVAVDAALTALRCGAKEVYMACLESEAEMPAGKWEIEEAISEGVKLLTSLGPEKIVRGNGRVTGLEMVACRCVFDNRGNFRPQFNKDSKECLPVDQVIVAIGQDPDLSFLTNDAPIQTRNGLILVDENTLETNMPTVYAGGDVIKTPGSVIYAVAAGRKAAASIDKALGGTGDIEEVLFERPAPNPFIGRNEGFATWPREPMPEPAFSKRQGFAEIALGYEREEAMKEASRCLQCDLHLAMGCNPSPPIHVLAFTEEEINKVPSSEGVFQLLDEARKVIAIKGTMNLRRELVDQLEENAKAKFFEFEEDKLYSKRETEMIQRYLQVHGEMPGSGDDDLF
jgi:formate dehydrogenase (NADP+) beta subunit